MRAEEEVVRRVLGSDRVRRVSVADRSGVDGRTVRLLTIVYNEEAGELSVEQMSEVIESLWRALLASGDDVFLVPSFVSSADQGVDAAA